MRTAGPLPTTIRNYKSQVEHTIRPRLGKVLLNRLSPKHLDDFYGVVKDGSSAKTIRNIHAIISGPCTKPSGGVGFGGTSPSARPLGSLSAG